MTSFQSSLKERPTRTIVVCILSYIFLFIAVVLTKEHQSSSIRIINFLLEAVLAVWLLVSGFAISKHLAFKGKR